VCSWWKYPTREKNKRITDAKGRVKKNNTTNSYVMALKKEING